VAIDREKVLAAAQSFVEKGKYDRAIAEYQKIIQEDPNDARTLLKIGDLYTKLAQHEKAIATYERVGKFYAQQGFALKAIAVFKQIKEIIARHVPHLEERYAHITPKLAELYQQLGLTSDALAALDEVAHRLLRSGRDKEAVDVFRRVVELDPQNPLPHLRLAEGLSRVRDLENAVVEFGIAAGFLTQLGRKEDALKVLERLLHHRPDIKYAKQAAELYLDRGNHEGGLQALPKLQICFQANPRDLETLNLLSRAFKLIGQPAKGTEVRKEMARLAKEQGKDDLCRDIVNQLQREAPNDEGVKQLVEMLKASPVETSVPSELIEEIQPDTEIVEERAFPLSSPPPPMHVSGDSVDEPPEIVAEEHVELVDDAVTADIQAQVDQLMADAQSYRRVRLYAKSIQALNAALEMDPRSIPIRVLMRDILLEAGRQDDAIHEMINIASLQLDALDGDGAAATLQDVMALDPQNERAAQMLRELGYELVDESQQQAQAAQTQEQAQQLPSYGTSYDAEAPLPSYDLDDDDAPQHQHQHQQHPALQHHALQQQPLPQFQTEIDDPFDSSAGPLPSFPLEAPESATSFELVAKAADTAVDSGPPTAATGAAATTATGTSTTPPTRANAAEIEEALEEADFFASRGLYEDARAVLGEMLSRTPNHPLLRERMGELEAQEQAAQKGSGTRAVPMRDKMASASDDAENFDIASSLEALEALDVAPEAANLMTEEHQVDVEEVFAKFKEGVAKQLDESDGQAHYDLGVAYKEMGLVDDAISEFKIAAKDNKRECVCWSMVGMIQMERGDINAAIDAFLKGLAAKVRTPEQETVLCFEIGAAFEAKRVPKEALTYYQRVVRRDPKYRDVQDRIRRLQKSEPKAPVRAMAVGAENDDEIDRAFDEIIGTGDKKK
jgi:tetratricopeptide (TPR) repeat protein